MGYNTSVLIMNDSMHEIAKDPEFGKKISDAAGLLFRGNKPIDIQVGGHCNAATVIEQHHADQTAILAVGGNYATVLGTHWSYAHHRPEDKLAILKSLADDLGFDISKKPSKKGSKP